MAKRRPKRGPRDPERVRELVLDAATHQFAERGFAGTSFRHVSERSGISAGLIQYHFGTKAELYEAVRKHVFDRYTEAQSSQFMIPDGDFDTFMDRGLRAYFRFFEDNPTSTRLSAWAELEGHDRPFPGEHAFMDMLVQRVAAGQAAGQLSAEIDPELLLIIIGGMMRGWLRYRDRYADRLEHLGSKAQREDAYLALCRDLLRRTSPDAAPPKKRKRKK